MFRQMDIKDGEVEYKVVGIYPWCYDRAKGFPVPVYGTVQYLR